MTGKYPPRIGHHRLHRRQPAGKLIPAPNGDHLPLEEVTIAEALRGGRLRDVLRRQVAPGHGRVLAQRPGVRPRPRRHGTSSIYPPSDAADPPIGRTTRRRPTGSPTRRSQFIERTGTGRSSPICRSSPCTPRSGRGPTWWRSTSARRRRRPPTPGAQERERQVRLVQNHAVYAAMLEQMDTAIGRVLARSTEAGHGRADDRRVHVGQRRALDLRRPSHLEPPAARAARAGSTRGASASPGSSRARRDEARQRLRHAGHQHGLLSDAARAAGPAARSRAARDGVSLVPLL